MALNTVVLTPPIDKMLKEIVKEREERTHLSATKKDVVASLIMQHITRKLALRGSLCTITNFT